MASKATQQSKVMPEWADSVDKQRSAAIASNRQQRIKRAQKADPAAFKRFQTAHSKRFATADAQASA